MRRGIQLVLGGLLLLVVIAAAVWGVWALVSWFLGLSTDTQTATAALLGVVSVPIITYFTSRSLERRRSRENAIREKKTELYDSMIKGFMDMLNIRKVKGGMSEPEMVAFFADAAPKLLTYGSRKVILAWNDFRAVSGTGKADSLTVILSFEELLKAMRNDLGHPTLTAGKGELVRTFITDFDSLRTATKKKSESGHSVSP